MSGAEGRAEARRKARLAIIATYEDLRRDLPVTAAVAALAADYNAGRIAALMEHRAVVPKVSESSIFVWLRTLREGGEDALKDRRRSHKRTYWQIYPDLRDLIEGQYFIDPEATAEEIHNRIAPTALENGWKMPSWKTVSRLLRTLDDAAQAAAGQPKRAKRRTRHHRARRDAFKQRPHLLRELMAAATVEEARDRIIRRCLREAWKVPTEAAIKAEWAARRS